VKTFDLRRPQVCQLATTRIGRQSPIACLTFTPMEGRIGSRHRSPAHRGSKRPPDMSYSHCGRWSSALAILAAPARRNGNSLAIPLPLRTQLNSRLTYKSLTAHAGEVFGRAEHGTGLFLKGFAGGGVIPGGTLQDEQYGQ